MPILKRKFEDGLFIKNKGKEEKDKNEFFSIADVIKANPDFTATNVFSVAPPEAEA